MTRRYRRGSNLRGVCIRRGTLRRLSSTRCYRNVQACIHLGTLLTCDCKTYSTISEPTRISATPRPASQANAERNTSSLIPTSTGIGAHIDERSPDGAANAV
ncbi:hypothetical protein SCLCIDRAFT_1217772 [Scleroderma citrinum Foug A]|uniref:Uncharacterized protein n=1 Tax=Scleroderma citrinum Foug A TaxID=1036808 RepID=A0A0C3DTX8_9AGAM|nr:hypothetical protein SCLCIDRAFT_1217772 [Scleroderma citrinum Foug A]